MELALKVLTIKCYGGKKIFVSKRQQKYYIEIDMQALQYASNRHRGCLVYIPVTAGLREYCLDA